MTKFFGGHGFGKKEFSRMEYESAEAEVKRREDIEKDVKEYKVLKHIWWSPVYDDYKWVPRLTHEDTVEAKKRLEKLYAKGQTEAIALNEEYGRLFARAQEALKAVEDFEREKLGMHKENPEK